MPDSEIKYETATVTTIRGLEGRLIARRENEGWELVSRQEQPMLRTSLTFRRVKPKPPWLLIAGLGSALVILAGIIAVMSVITGTGNESTAPTGASTAATSPLASTPAATSTSAAEVAAAAPPSEVPAYDGLPYEVVSIDKGQSSADLDQYWVLADGIDGSSAGGRDQIRAIIRDVARTEGSSSFFAEVVSDREIALAESPSTMESFVEERGLDYFEETIPQLEKAGWVASYAGGFDYNTGEASESAFEIMWLPASDDPETEAWEAVATRG